MSVSSKPNPILAGFVALIVLAADGFAQDELLSQAPMRDWVSWIREVRPTRDLYQGPTHRLTPAQWEIERAYVVLLRLGQHCESDGYPIKLAPFDFAVTRLTGSGWPGVTMLPGHADNRGERIQIAVEVAYEQHKQLLCAAFNRRLGRDGDLVAPLRRFTDDNEPAYRYANIVMWSDAEICLHPEEYWQFDWRNPRARPTLEQLWRQSCKGTGKR